MNIEEAKKSFDLMLEELKNFIIGKELVLKHVIITMIANGHILFEDFPGLAKTQIVKLLSQIMELDYKRIQFTPDLLPADITGSYIFDLKNQEFALRKGPLFSQLVLADEINRAPPKTQAALLEAMGENQITIEGNTFFLNKPFWVIATQNPVELEGTFGLPEAQLDRFLTRLRIGYPTIDEEDKILVNRIIRKADEMKPRKIITIERFIEIQSLLETVYISKDIISYITRIVHATRNHPRLEVGASPRGSLALLSLARASALINGRDYAIPEDVKEFIIPALAHRVILKTGEWLGGLISEKIIEEITNTVVAPRKDLKFTK